MTHLRLVPAASYPLNPEELITDDLLRDFAKGGAERAMGEISAEHTAQLVMVLPDMCGELLARRAAMKHHGGTQPDAAQLAGGCASSLGPSGLFFKSSRSGSEETARGGVATAHGTVIQRAPAKNHDPISPLSAVQLISIAGLAIASIFAVIAAA